MSAASNGRLELRLSARPESACNLRQHLRDWLAASDVSEPDAFALILATVEAFTNAVEHARQSSKAAVKVKGSVSDDCVTISVRDHGTWRTESRKEQGGLGLSIIEVLMDSARVDRGPDGTTVTMSRRLVG